ncbi:transcriptional regulator [Marinitenerispora sediminis]|uniref:Transcriptional regulator n=1 Tax=Marinitenerispora sediminis TaxID=1931232 RepID=A0A368SYV7_9ACTN|nr:transcriptional regulator [Marinitenerispora sediminis]RCV48103.1 transcriptional regulator [Marinitenerispora sediminis]RCV49570.1 transcriptional regulator [Marinitenerispora sediminis]
METEQVGRRDEDRDVTRVDSLAREVFAGIANKWALLVINILGERTLRFTELRAEVEGISHKMLTQTLRGLERDGVVRRTVHPTVPPRVEYRLTEAGQALRGTVNGMCAWTRRYLDEIEGARRRFDARRADAAR